MANSGNVNGEELILTLPISKERIVFSGAKAVVSCLTTKYASKVLFRIHIMHGNVDFEEFDIIFTDSKLSELENNFEATKKRVTQLVKFLRVCEENGSPAVYMDCATETIEENLPTLFRGCRVQVRVAEGNWISGKVSRVSEDGTVRVHAENGMRLKNLMRHNIRILGKRITNLSQVRPSSSVEQKVSSSHSNAEANGMGNLNKNGLSIEAEISNKNSAETKIKEEIMNEMHKEATKVQAHFRRHVALREYKSSGEVDKEPESGSSNETIAELGWPTPYNVLPTTEIPDLTDDSARAQLISSGGVRLFAVTFNVGKATLNSSQISEMIKPRKHHVYFISIQFDAFEPIDERKSEKSYGDEITREIQLSLGESYRHVASGAVDGLYFCLMSQNSLHRCFKNIEINHTPLGVSENDNGNSTSQPHGATGISFTLYDSTFVLINSSLTQGQNRSSARNANFGEVNARLHLPAACDPSKALTERFDYVIWVGNLNYRIEGNRTIVDSWVENLDFPSMWANEQLRKSWKEGSVFQGYSEGPLNFLPTYKYDIGSDNYDTSSRKRVPGWTDRILWKKNSRASLLAYDSYDLLSISNSRPVWAVFHLCVDVNDSISSLEYDTEKDKTVMNGKMKIDNSSVCNVM